MSQQGDFVDISYSILTRQMLRGLAYVALVPGILCLFVAALVERPSARLGLVGIACLAMWLSFFTARGKKNATCVSLAWWAGCIFVFTIAPLHAIYHFLLSSEETGSGWTDLFAVLGSAIVLLWFLRRAVPYSRAVWRYCRQGDRDELFLDRARADRRNLPRRSLAALIQTVGWKRLLRSLGWTGVALMASAFVLYAILVFGIAFVLQSRGSGSGLFVGFALVAAGFLLRSGVRRARRYVLRSAVQVQAADDRPPVVLLRSFDDDATKLNGPEHHFPLQSVMLEEVVADALWMVGPVIAIGRPGEELAPLGAAREYVVDRAWQDRVLELLGQAALIVAVMGDSAGLEWEYRAIASAGLRDRLLLIVPPVDDASMRRRWMRAESALGREIGSDLMNETLMVNLGKERTFAVRAVYRDVEAYRLALSHMLRRCGAAGG